LIDDFLVEINLSLEKIPSLFLRYPLVHGMKLGNREWQLDEILGDETWHCSDEMGNEGVLEEIWPIGQAAWIDQTQREAFELSQLRHDHLSQILDWGIDPSSGRWFLVYPYVKGISFLNKLQERAMSEAEIRSFFIQIASALEMCAKRGVFHRQIRLENLFLVSDEKAVITRFGIHRGQFPAWKWSFDLSSFRKKTYAPELFEKASFGQPSDIYSFAVCMAICLFPEAEHLPKISDFPKVFQPFFKKALQQEATQRFLDWTSVLEALREIKPVYQYRNLSALKNDPFGENPENQSNAQSYSLLEVVALILENPDDPHEIWQTNFGKDWKSWQSVDEVEQLVLAAIQKEKERQTKKLQKEQEEKEKTQEKEKEREKIRQYLQNEHRHKNLSQEEEGQKERSSKANLLVRNHFAKDGVIKKKTAFLNHQLYSTPQPAGSLHLIPNGDLTLNFCYVPIGEFLMGSPNLPTTPQLERPMHLVSFTRPFLLFQTPVTQALFEMVMGYNPSYFYGKSRPVEQVSWFEAAAFCNRLSQREGLVPAYFFSEKLDHIAIMADSDGYRLPTEAEWEYAAKAGQIFDFSGSPSFEEIAWFEENSQGQTQAVAQKKPNAWGLYDMSGNVAEWCHDGLRRYNKACQDPIWDTSEEAFYPLMRAIKGGSWRKPSALGKVSSRAQHMSIYKRKYLGFRIIRPLLPVLFSYDQE
jgi:formylglycine-generating enzyme required for sulfatase activity